MTAEQWEALAILALDLLHDGDGEVNWDHVAECSDPECCRPQPMTFAGLALFARLMAVAMKLCEGRALSGGICGDCATEPVEHAGRNENEADAFCRQINADQAKYDREDLIQWIRSIVPADRGPWLLLRLLRAYHAGNPSALDALLGEAWGERPRAMCGDTFQYANQVLTCERDAGHEEPSHAAEGVFWRDV